MTNYKNHQTQTMNKIISQLDYPHIKFPGTIYSWATYGCLASCLCMLLDKTVEEFIHENPNGWDSQANLKTDAVLAKYGFKLIRKNLLEGQPLQTYPYPVIYRTSFFSPKFATHFFVQQPNSFDIIDPASRYNPKAVNRYRDRINEVRYLEPLNEQPVKRCECCKRPY